MTHAALTPLTPVIADGGAYWAGYVVGSLCCFAITAVIFWYFMSGFIQEAGRGKKGPPGLEEVLDDLPKKKPVVFRGEKVPDWKTAPRQKATRALLKFLSYTDNWFEKKYITDVADEAFRLVKQAVEDRSVKGIERRVTPDCLAELQGEIRKLKRERELHVFGRVEVTNVEVLHVEVPAGKENHTFTALISAQSKDFFEDDETGELVRGEKKTFAYQEFWTFRRSEKRWLVELIRPSADVDAVLESKNVMAQIDYEEFAKEAKPEYLEQVTVR